MNQNNQLKRAQESLDFIRRQLAILRHDCTDKESTESILDCFIELNHLDYVIDDIRANQNIPFFVKGGGIA